MARRRGERPDARRAPLVRARRGGRRPSRPRSHGALSQTHRANVAAEDAESYQTVLAHARRQGVPGRHARRARSRTRSREASSCTTRIEGQSWGIVLVRAPGVSGNAERHALQLAARTGPERPIDAGTLEFQPDGDAATWLVTSSDLTPFDRVTITADDGTVLATADIEPA